MDSGCRVSCEHQRWVCRHLPSLRRLLAAGAHVHSRDYHGQTPMHSAAVHTSVGGPDVGRGRCVRVTTDRGRRVVELTSLTLPMSPRAMWTFPVPTVRARPQRTVHVSGLWQFRGRRSLSGPRSVRCGRFARAASLVPFNLLQAPPPPQPLFSAESAPILLRQRRPQRFCGLCHRGLLRPDLPEVGSVEPPSGIVGAGHGVRPRAETSAEAVGVDCTLGWFPCV